MEPPSRPPALKWLDCLLTAGAVAIVIWFYHWTDGTSGGLGPPGEGDYYHFLVEGWRQGHLYLSQQPSPRMLALSDPYDPAQNQDVRLGDASYYRGHYYLYFGAVPAAVLMLPHDLLSREPMSVGKAIFTFSTIGFLAASALWLLIRRRYFFESAFWTGAVGVLVLGLGTHVLVLLRRPFYYELAIASAYAFSMLALLAIHAALHGKRPVLMLGLAGLCLGLAVGSRPTYLLGIAMFAPVLWYLRRHASALWLRSAIAAAVGFGVCLGAIFWYNSARFGNPLDFGQNFQLSGVYESKMRHFSLTYMAHNAWIYFFHPANGTPHFPFIAATAVNDGPPGYLGMWNEQVAGLGVSFPIVWAALALPLFWRGRTTEEETRLQVIAGSVGLLSVAMLAVMLAYYLATPRYMVDFTPALMLLACLGGLGIERWAQRKRLGGVTTPLIATLALTTIVVGVLLSFDYHHQLFRIVDPQDWARLQRLGW